MHKTIFISSYHSLISRNILQTEILDILGGKNLKIVILVHPSKVEYFNDSFKKENIEIVGITPGESFFDSWIYFISISLISVENLFVGGLLDRRMYLKFYLAHFIHQVFGKFYASKTALRFIASVLSKKNTYSDLFKQYKPDLVFSTDIYDTHDRDLIRESKKNGIPTIGMVRSWDNVTTKGVLLSVPERIIVPSDILKDELIEYNKIKPDKISVTGIPHYDECIKPRKISREQFFEKMGLDPNKKLILVAPAGTILYKHDGEALKLLQELKRENAFSAPLQFLVRFPIGYGIGLDGFDGGGDFVFDSPGSNVSGGSGEQKFSELTKGAALHLNDSLYYSDIIITLTSTIAIDAAVFDKPAIIYSIKKNKSDDIKKFLKYTHYKKFINFNFTKLATSRAELIDYINGYLVNPDLDKDRRSELVGKYCYKLDGNSSKRVARLLLESIHSA